MRKFLVVLFCSFVCIAFTLEKEPNDFDEFYWIYEEFPDIDAEYFSFIKSHSHSFVPYSSGEFTHLSEEQIEKSKRLTDNPKWASSDPEKAAGYYALQEETTLDRFLCYIASTLVKVVV